MFSSFSRRALAPLFAAATLGATGFCSVGVSSAWAQTPPKAAVPAAKPAKEDAEIKMGREAHEEMLKDGLKLVRDPKVMERVERIGKKLADIARVTPLDASYGSSTLVPYEYHFFVVDDPDINAFCLPGGYIYINSGLLNYVQSDDELAGVIGHEITHAAHHHVLRLQKEQSKINNQMLLGALVTLVARVPAADAMNVIQGLQLVAIQKLNGFGQTAEKDADHGGVIFTEKAGYNPVGMLTFMERLERDQRMRPDIDQGIFRTHPPEKQRAEAITKQLTAMNVPIQRRAVTNMLKVAVKTVPIGNDKTASEVTLDNRPLFRTASRDRADESAKTLDGLLNDDIQLYDVTRKGASVLVRGEIVWTAQPDDAVLTLGMPAAPASGTPANKNAPLKTASVTTSAASTDSPFAQAASTNAPAASTPEKAAEAAYKALRNALFKQFLEYGG